ncbi:MAG: ATP-binding protein [Deltaproteobacteria bacterium]|nr:ATP-binding protein [Deltaproteobacteria bacterium]
MAVGVTLKNYRCFNDSKPARFTLRKGFTSFIGVNNSGKSSLLKFFYEFRELFQKIGTNVDGIIATMTKAASFNFPRSVFDIEEVFNNGNNRDLEIQFVFTFSPTSSIHQLAVTRVSLKLPRNSDTPFLRLSVDDNWLDFGGHKPSSNGTLLQQVDQSPVADVEMLLPFFQSLANTLYIGPFRNILGFTSNEDYFDIKVGQAFVQIRR